MTLLRISCLVALITSLNACGDYQQMEEYGGIPFGGYTDTRINQNTAIVTFRGNIFQPQSEIRTLLINRCAEVTLANGYDYFVVTSITSSPVNVNLHEYSTYNNYVTNPPRLVTAYPESVHVGGYHLSPSATYVSNSDGGCLNCHGSQLHNMVAVIKMFQGDIPPGLPNAYSAQDMIAHLSTATF